MKKQIAACVSVLAVALSLGITTPAVAVTNVCQAKTVAAKAQTGIKLKANIKAVSYEALQSGARKAGTVSVSGLKGNSKITYVKTGGAGCVSIAKKSGKITVAKGAKSATYSLKVKARVTQAKTSKTCTLAKTFKVEVASTSSNFKDRLASLKGVTSVKEAEDPNNLYAQRYMVTIKQPISWDDSSVGTFQQRVEVGYQDAAAVNVYKVGGYCLSDVAGDPASIDRSAYYAKDSRVELTKDYDANQLSIEYRFFGDSTPAGLSNNSTALWKYLTVENAAKDFHRVITILSRVLPGKRVFTGASKGGFTTNVQSMYFPNDANAFVSYSAPLCDGTQDPAFYQNAYETIGNEGFDATTAKYLRDIIVQFQVECIKNRDKFQDKLWNTLAEQGYTFHSQVTKGILYDYNTLELAVAPWQLGTSIVGKFKAALEMPEGDERDEAMFNLMAGYSSASDLSPDSYSFAYIVQSEMQMGNYKVDFSYLRQALADAGVGDGLVVTEDMEDGFRSKMIFTPEQQKAFAYDGGALRNKLIENFKTTKANVILIYGGCDPWYAVRIPCSYNPNVHRYVFARGPHRSSISDLTQEDQAECRQLLDSWLK